MIPASVGSALFSVQVDPHAKVIFIIRIDVIHLEFAFRGDVLGKVLVNIVHAVPEPGALG